jgi:starvation-inducible DNA-binding protein
MAVLHFSGTRIAYIRTEYNVANSFSPLFWRQIMSARTTTTKSEATTTFPTRIDIPAEVRVKIISLLNQQLADTFDLMAQTKFAHWNVKGPNFIAVHELFDELAEKLEKHVDTIAERATGLGGVAMGTVRQTAAMSRTPEFPAGVHRSADVISALVERYAAVGKSSREAIDAADGLEDRDTADLFTAVSREIDQALYFLEAHLNG